MTNKDRRRHERIDTPDKTTVIELKSASSGKHETCEVKVQNISNCGICIVTSNPIELGQIVHFPEESINKTGEVVWTYQLKEEHKSGINFE